MKSQQQTSNSDDALLHFNHIKDVYQRHIEELTDLKRLIFSQSDSQLDQQLRSKLRITIESLLIDLNEEVFALSEELARSFTFERNRHSLASKAQEFEQRQKILLKKIKDSINSNATIKTLRRSQRIAQQSPPQRDLNTFGAGTDESDRNRHEPHPQNIHMMKDPSPQVKRQSKKLLHNNSAHKLQDNSLKKRKSSSQWNPVEIFQVGNQPYSTTNYQKQSLKKKKSPTPLRRKDYPHSFQLQQDDSLTLEAQKRTSISKNSLSAKKQLFRNDNSDSRKVLAQNDKGNVVKKSVKKLEDFEIYLAKKKKNGFSSRQNSSQKNKENKLPQDNANENQQYSSIVLQSEAFEVFAQDFAHMKNRMIQMQQKINQNEDKTRELVEQVCKLKNENLKLSTDVKIIGSEHGEVLQAIHNIERKNIQLQQENQILKRMITGERELKGQESNMPKQYEEQNVSMNSPHKDIESRRVSPFSSFLQKNRSFNHIGSYRDQNNLQQEDQNKSSASLRNIKLSNDSYHRANNQAMAQEYQGNQGLNLTYGHGQLAQSFERDLNNNNSTSYVRPQPNNYPANHNPLLSASHERLLTQDQSYSFLRLQPQHISQTQSVTPSNGPSSLRGESHLPPISNFNNRLQKTPTTPDNVFNQNGFQNDTPSRRREMGGQALFSNTGNIERSRSYIVDNKMRPSSLSQNKQEGKGELSEWVLERMKKQ